MYDIDWSQKAFKQLVKIKDHQAAKGILAAVDQLTVFPSCHGVKRLENHRYGYRLRVGHYRVLFDVHKEIRIIEIQEVKKRDEHTY
jgi:mRNA interferase RelE/StbE